MSSYCRKSPPIVLLSRSSAIRENSSYCFAVVRTVPTSLNDATGHTNTDPISAANMKAGDILIKICKLFGLIGPLPH